MKSTVIKKLVVAARVGICGAFIACFVGFWGCVFHALYLGIIWLGQNT